MHEPYCVTYPERHTISCGKCREQHSSAEGVRKCHEGAEISSCAWLCRTGEYTEDGEQVVAECGADSWDTPRGWKCAAGHEHVNDETRTREGWDYACDEGEADQLRSYGVDAVSVRGDSI